MGVGTGETELQFLLKDRPHDGLTWGSPPFPYQMKSATEGNWLLQMVRDRKQHYEAGSRREAREIAQGPALAPPFLQLCLVPMPLASHTPFPGSWPMRLKGCRSQGQRSQVFQPMPDTSRDGSLAASPRNQLCFAFSPTEICFSQSFLPSLHGTDLQMSWSSG